MTRQQYLQDLMDLKTKDHPEIGDWYIEYRPFDGGYTVPDYPRYTGDPGEFLGVNWKQSAKAIKRFYKP